MAGKERLQRVPEYWSETGEPALAGACAGIVQAGKATPDAVAAVIAALLEDSDWLASPVTAAEARCLIETNDAVAFARNCPEWRALYAHAIGNYLAARAGIATPGLARVDWIGPQANLPVVPLQVGEPSSAAWLIRQVARSQNVSPAEQALLVLLDQRLPGLARGLVAHAC